MLKRLNYLKPHWLVVVLVLGIAVACGGAAAPDTSTAPAAMEATAVQPAADTAVPPQRP